MIPLACDLTHPTARLLKEIYGAELLNFRLY